MENKKTSWNKGLKGYGRWSKWHPTGEANPFYGKKHSEETKAKMKAAKVGKKRQPLSEETKRKISIANRGKKPTQTGENHWNWKGGISEADLQTRVAFRSNMQRTILLRDNYTCQVCDQYGGYLQIDHIKPWAEYPELRFNEDNCRTLCMACHYYVTFKRKIPEGIIWGHNLSRRIAS